MSQSLTQLKMKISTASQFSQNSGRWTAAILLVAFVLLFSGCRDEELVAPEDNDCDASFTYAEDTGCNVYKFTNTTVSVGTPVYTWTVSDDNDTVLATPTVIPISAPNKNFSYSFPKAHTDVTYHVKLEASGKACGDETDDDVQDIVVPGIMADFDYEQDSCPNSPLVVKFTDKSFGQNLTYQWNIAGTTYVTQNAVHTFPAGGTYTVTLTVTLPNGCTDTHIKVIQVKTNCEPSFNYVYNACKSKKGTFSPPVTVGFTNTSEGGLCPWKFTWDFGDGSPSLLSLGGTVSHTYASFGFYPVTLDMEDSASCNELSKQKINIQPCEADFTYHVCPDGSVVYRTNSPNPKWSFPGGSASTTQGSEVFVDYGATGDYGVAMTSIDDNHCRCVVEKKITISEVVKCTPNDSERGTTNFYYKGKSYQLRYKLVVRNLLGIHRVKAKAVLWGWKYGLWIPIKANEIRASWSGSTYTSDKDCACVFPDNENEDSGTQNNRARAKKVHDLDHAFCVRDQDLTGTFSVKVDSSQPPIVATLLTGFKKDRCKRVK